MRCREWYCWHFPELKDLVRDNYVFAKCAALIGDRASLDEAKQAQLVEKVGSMHACGFFCPHAQGSPAATAAHLNVHAVAASATGSALRILALVGAGVVGKAVFLPRGLL